MKQKKANESGLMGRNGSIPIGKLVNLTTAMVWNTG